MNIHKDLRVMSGDTVAVVLDVAQDGKYAKIQYGDTVHWVLSSLLQPFSEEEAKEPRLLAIRKSNDDGEREDDIMPPNAVKRRVQGDEDAPVAPRLF